jgi:hypothetical protein
MSLTPAKVIADWLTQICMETKTDDYNQTYKGGNDT